MDCSSFDVIMALVFSSYTWSRVLAREVIVQLVNSELQLHTRCVLVLVMMRAESRKMDDSSVIM